MPRRVRIAPTLRAARVRRQLTQQRLAEQLGRKKRTVQAWEAGEKVPSGPSLELLAAELGLELELLVELAESERWLRRQRRERGVPA